MKTKLGIILSLLLILLTGFVHAQETRPVVKTVTPEINTIEVKEVVNGLVEPYANLMLSTTLGGVVDEVKVQVGQKVEAGELLMLLDQDQLKIQMAQASAALEIAQANLALINKGASEEEMQQVEAAVQQAQASYDAAQSSLDFAQSMYKDRRVQQQQLLTAKTQFQMAEKQRELANQQLKQAQTALETAEADYQRMTYLYDNGVITQKQYEGIELQYQNAQMAKQSAQLAVEQADVSYTSGEEGYRLAEELYEDRRSAEQQLIGARTQLEVATANLAIAQANLSKVLKGASSEQVQISQANVKQATAALNLVQLQLENTLIESPIDGIVAQVNADAGEMVGPGTPAIVILDLSQVYVKADVTANLLKYLQIGDPAQIQVGIESDIQRQGQIALISPMADLRTQAFPIKILLDNPGGYLKAGMYADVHLTIEKSVDTILLPIEVIMALESSPYLYVIEDGHAVKRSIQTGLVTDQRVEILTGIFSGDQVVIKGQHLVQDGEQVEVIQ